MLVTVVDVVLVSFYRLSSGHLVVEKYPHLTNSAQVARQPGFMVWGLGLGFGVEGLGFNF